LKDWLRGTVFRDGEGLLKRARNKETQKKKLPPHFVCDGRITNGDFLPMRSFAFPDKGSDCAGLSAVKALQGLLRLPNPGCEPLAAFDPNQGTTQFIADAPRDRIRNYSLVANHLNRVTGFTFLSHLSGQCT
jgi:hypothetical protein